MKSMIKIEPRYQETDQMGVIHHSVYPVWYEMGRIKFCDDIGLPFAELEKENIGLAMISMSSFYKKPTYFGQTYQLITYLREFGRLKMKFEYELYDQEMNMVHHGETNLVWLSDDFRPLDIMKKNPVVYHKFLEAISPK
jgi:acyl-CoA thioester hydrolase